MNRGIYPMLSGAIAQEKRLETIAHNTANVNTVGFKKETGVFSSLIAQAGISPTWERISPGWMPPLPMRFHPIEVAL